MPRKRARPTAVRAQPPRPAAAPAPAKPAAASAVRKPKKEKAERRFGDDLDYVSPDYSESDESSGDSPEAELSPTGVDDFDENDVVVIPEEESDGRPVLEEEFEDDGESLDEFGDEGESFEVYWQDADGRPTSAAERDNGFSRAMAASFEEDKQRSCKKRTLSVVEKGLLSVAKGWKPAASQTGGEATPKCLGCFTEEKAIVALPCRHACYCVECFSNKSNDSKSCPFCRHRVGVWISVQQLAELKPIY
jgi:hypothetical protein